MKLKKICEVLKGKKITENCYEGEDIQSKSDITRSDFTGAEINWMGQNIP